MTVDVAALEAASEENAMYTEQPCVPGLVGPCNGGDVTWENGTPYSTNPYNDCSYGYDASCQYPPGLFPNGEPIFGGGGISVGMGGFISGGCVDGGPMSNDFGGCLPAVQTPPQGSGCAGTWSECAPGSGGNFAATAAVAVGVLCPECDLGIVVGGLLGYDIAKLQQLLRAHEMSGPSGSPTIDCWNQFARDLQNCNSAYPDGPQKQACYAAARINLKMCLAGVGRPVQ